MNKLELSRGCTSYGIYFNDENVGELSTEKQKEILIDVINSLEEGSNIQSILEYIIEVEATNYERANSPCEQCGDTWEQYTLEYGSKD